jgi:hypothetical protein
VEAAVAGAKPLESVFSDRQRAFLADCADAHVPFDALDILGPVDAVRWNGVRLDHHEVTLEHWTLSPAAGHGGERLDWFEVSERVAPEGAEGVQASLTAHLRAQGLEPDLPGQGTTTRRVLETLARGA